VSLRTRAETERPISHVGTELAFIQLYIITYIYFISPDQGESLSESESVQIRKKGCEAKAFRFERKEKA
jgi:hypothetical protein